MNSWWLFLSGAASLGTRQGEEGMAYANLIVSTCFDWTLNLSSHERHILLLHMPLSLGCSPALNARGYRNGKKPNTS